MNSLIITQNAVEVMWKQSQGCPTETGGVLIGVQDPLFIYQAGEPGPAADKHLARFTTDPAQDRETLQTCRQRTGRQVQIIGYWHKHPHGLQHPSGGDLAQSREILRAWHEVGDPDPLMIAIILQESQTALHAIHPYVLKFSGSAFEPMEYLMVENDAQVVLETLRNQPPYLMKNSPEHIWSTVDFRFQSTPGGRKRLELENQALEQAGWHAIWRQQQTDGHILVELEKDANIFVLRLPREYPLNPPVWLDSKTGHEKSLSGMVLPWNSDRSLLEWLEHCLPLMNPLRVETNKGSMSFLSLLWALTSGILFLGGYLFAKWTTWSR